MQVIQLVALNSVQQYSQDKKPYDYPKRTTCALQESPADQYFKQQTVNWKIVGSIPAGRARIFFEHFFIYLIFKKLETRVHKSQSSMEF